MGLPDLTAPGSAGLEVFDSNWDSSTKGHGKSPTEVFSYRRHLGILGTLYAGTKGRHHLGPE